MTLAEITLLLVQICGTLRAADLAPHVQAASDDWHVPATVLVSQIRQESGCDVNATGKLGEIGLMQLKLGTWALDGYHHKSAREIRKPALNIWLGARHVRRCWDKCTSSHGALSLYKGIPRKKGVCRNSSYARTILQRAQYVDEKIPTLLTYHF